MKIFVFLVVVVAIVIGLLTRVPREYMLNLIIFRDFFDAALPVLAFGALIKYLCTCCMKCKKCHKEGDINKV